MDLREESSQKVLKKAIETNQAAALLDALSAGGGYSMTPRGELIPLPRTVLSSRKRDAISIVLTAHSAGVLGQVDELGLPTVQAIALRDAIVEKIQHIIDGMGSLTGQPGFALTGIEETVWDRPATAARWLGESDADEEPAPEPQETVVAYVYRSHMMEAKIDYETLGLLYGAPPDHPAGELPPE